jgi:acyl transferase domain-containing protein
MGLFLLMLVSAIEIPWPSVAAARGGSRDPTVQWERQRKRTEDHKSKRREQLDLQGAETRDAKKSAEDSRQSQMQTELGNPNPQTDRWIGY